MEDREETAKMLYQQCHARSIDSSGQALNPFAALSNYQRTESEIRMEGKLDRIIALLEELKSQPR